MPVAFRVSGAINIRWLEQVFLQITERHQILRTQYINTAKGPVQRVRDAVSFNIPSYDLSGLTPNERQQNLLDLLATDARKPFDLRNDLMVRVSYVLLEKGCQANKSRSQGVLLFNMHNIASDGWSMAILAKEFTKIG